MVQQLLTMANRGLPHSSLLHPEPHSDQRPIQQQQHQQQRHTLQQRQQLLMDFRRAYYLKDDISHLDIVFYIIHLAMSAVHKRLLVTSRQQLGFECAMSLFSAALLMRLFFKPLYTRVRPILVFNIHVLLTFIRAGVVMTMATKQVGSTCGAAAPAASSSAHSSARHSRDSALMSAETVCLCLVC